MMYVDMELSKLKPIIGEGPDILIDEVRAAISEIKPQKADWTKYRLNSQNY